MGRTSVFAFESSSLFPTYGRFTYIWLKQTEHVGKYSQSHGAWFPNEDGFGGCLEPCQETKQRVIFYWKCNIPGTWNPGRGKSSVYMCR